MPDMTAMTTMIHAPTLLPLPDFMARVDRTIHPKDYVYPGFAAARGPDAYFSSAHLQLEEIDRILCRHAGTGVPAQGTIVDYGCHYGRMARALPLLYPAARVIAADLDAEATGFCADRFGCAPLSTPWSAAAPLLPSGSVDMVLCISLLTHVAAADALTLLARWRDMLRPGGVLFTTFLGPGFVDTWAAGGLTSYAPIALEQREATVAAFHRDGHGFSGFSSGYSAEGRYGIAFYQPSWLRAAVQGLGGLAAHVIGTAEAANVFGQDIILLQRE